MRIIDIIGMCIRSLWRRKIRTMLTVSGVVIGSCAIVVMISLGLGMNKAMEQMLSQFGSLNVITVYPQYGSSEGTNLDDKAIETLRQIDGVSDIFAQLELDAYNYTLSAGKNGRYRMRYGSIIGVFPETLEKFGYVPKDGSLEEFINGGSGKNGVMLFSHNAAYSFSDTKKRGDNSMKNEYTMSGEPDEPFFNPLDEDLMLYPNKTDSMDNNGYFKSPGKKYEHKFSVAAVMEQNNNGGWYTVYVDMNTAKQLVEESNRVNNVKKTDITYSQLQIYVDNIDDVAEVQANVEQNGFSCYSMDNERQEINKILMIVQLVLGGLAAISLLVAAIGITNTMIMSIYERTREIGVMKVLGCYISNIRLIFLMEAGCIGFLGGALGVLISFGLSFIFNKAGLVMSILGSMGADAGALADAKLSIIPVWLVLLALGFSTLIGLISGYYPANRAVKISALEAIKNE